MQYSAVTFQFDFDLDFAADLFINELAEIGFDSFENTQNGCIAYIPTQQLDKTAIAQLVKDFAYPKVSIVDISDIEDKDWNEEWEKNFFQPIVIDNRCVIHSTFHHDYPHLPYDIIINPQMAFGTGHHQTTSMMLQAILETDFTNKEVLDMGCGTAVLGILAKMKGAKHVTAIDIDDWCVRNALENIALNKIEDIDVRLGDANLLKDKHFDIILANINRNILLNDMPYYAAALQHSGMLFMSGFYTDDIPAIIAKGNTLGLHLSDRHQTDNWAMIKMRCEM